MFCQFTLCFSGAGWFHFALLFLAVKLRHARSAGRGEAAAANHTDQPRDAARSALAFLAVPKDPRHPGTGCASAGRSQGLQHRPYCQALLLCRLKLFPPGRGKGAGKVLSASLPAEPCRCWGSRSAAAALHEEAAPGTHCQHRQRDHAFCTEHHQKL